MSTLEKSFMTIDTSAGTRNISLEGTLGKVWEMRVQFPKKKSGSKTLVIALHWAGGEVYEEYSKCLAEPGLADLDAVVIVPDGEGVLWTAMYNEKKVMKLVELAKRYWNIDQENVIVTGYSNGGIGSWFFADRYPKVFSAAIPIASIYTLEEEIKIPMYVIHGEKDELFEVGETENLVNNAQKLGSKIKYRRVPEFTHYMACDYVEELKLASTWVMKQLEK